MNSTNTSAHGINDLRAVIQAMDATAQDGLQEIERLASGALGGTDGLSAALAAVLDSVQFLAQRIANDINVSAEAVGADCRLALG